MREFYALQAVFGEQAAGGNARKRQEQEWKRKAADRNVRHTLVENSHVLGEF
jgi:hypothetical protein